MTDSPDTSDPGVGDRGEIVHLGLLGLLAAGTTAMLLLPLAPGAAAAGSVGALVALSALGLLLVLRWRRPDAAPGRYAPFTAQVLWFWGAVTGLTFLLGVLTGAPDGPGAALSGALAGAVWAVLMWFVGPHGRRRGRV